MGTLADIAVRAGVSQATASRVINGKPGVSGQARQAVLTAMDTLGYARPTRLERRSSGLVGLVVPELDNPIFPLFAQEIETVLARHGLTPVLCTQTPGGITEADYVESLLEHGVAGIIFVSGEHSDTRADHAAYRKLVELGLPVVLVNGYLPELGLPCVSDNDEEAVELAVSHLVDLGHRRIGLAVGPEHLMPARRKIDAFTHAMGRLLELSSREADSWVERTMFSIEGGHAAAQRLLERGATAIVCGSDLMALGAVRMARQAGLDVPGGLSVVGYDDSPLVAYLDPPLTTVRQSVRAMGVAAVNLMVEAVNGSPAPAQEYLFRPELVLRGSTGVPRREG
jgi:LacI family repressor for deo operon, udp, cdd, tsx, nupC, and nupG